MSHSNASIVAIPSKAPGGRFRPEKFLLPLLLLRMLLKDPIVQALRAQRPGWSNPVLLRMVAEALAVETVEAPEIGRALCHWILRQAPMGSWRRLRRRLILRGFIDACYDKALEAVKEAHASGSLRAVVALQHPDEAFVAQGLTVPPGHVLSSPRARVRALLEPDKEVGLMDYDPKRDFLFDLTDGKWYLLDRQGEWSSGVTEQTFSTRLLYLGMPRNKQDAFKTHVPQCERAEPIFDTQAYIVERRGVRIRNTYRRSLFRPEPGTWFNIRKVLLNLVNGNAEHLEFLLDWLAAPLQSLHRNGKPLKMGTAIVFHGDEGSGKGTLERIICLIYGRWNVALLGQNALESRFHEQLVDKLFVVANEVISSTNRSAETQNLLKPWVTDDEIPLEAKHKSASKVPNRFNIIFTSNDEKPVIVPRKDRRYTVFKTGPRLPQKLSDAVYADLNGPQLEVAAFYWHLLHRKVRVKVGQVLDTEARREVQVATASSDEKFVAALKHEGWFALCAPWAEVQRRKRPDDAFTTEENTNEGYAVLASRLNEVYKDFCERQNLKPRDQTQLGKTLKAEVPGARSKLKKIGPMARQMWFGLPMMPPETKAAIIPLPTAQQAPVEEAVRPAESAVDDADFGTDAA